MLIQYIFRSQISTPESMSKGLGAKPLITAVIVAIAMFSAGYFAAGTAPATTIILTTTVPGERVTATETVTATVAGVGGLDLKLDIAGSTTVAPIAEEAARLFTELYPEFKISVAGIGSGPGVKAVGSGEVDIGMASRDIKEKEYERWPDLMPWMIGKDSVAIVVHLDNPVSDLTLEQVAKIYAGEITNWKEVGGPDLEIHVITREKGSGTRDCFEKGVMKPFSKEITGRATVQEGNPKVRAAVAKDPAAIGFLSLGFIDPTVKPLKINGVEPTIDNVLAGRYPIVRNLYLITKGKPSPAELMFIGFVLSAEGQRIVAELGYIPLYQPPD